jgi:hypothetical protein
MWYLYVIIINITMGIAEYSVSGPYTSHSLCQSQAKNIEQFVSNSKELRLRELNCKLKERRV